MQAAKATMRREVIRKTGIMRRNDESQRGRCKKEGTHLGSHRTQLRVPPHAKNPSQLEAAGHACFRELESPMYRSKKLDSLRRSMMKLVFKTNRDVEVASCDPGSLTLHQTSGNFFSYRFSSS